MATNVITGDRIATKGVLSQQGRDNFDVIFPRRSKRVVGVILPGDKPEQATVIIDDPLAKSEPTTDQLMGAWPTTDIRIDIIGQNGNDGDHYSDSEGGEE